VKQRIKSSNQLERFGPHYIVFLLFLASAFSFVDRQILSILFEPIKGEFDLSDTQLGLLGGIAFALTYSILGVPLAMLADRRGRKGIITASLAIFSIMTAFCGAAGSFATLVLARIGVGIGEAGVNPSSSSMIADLFPKEKRSTPMAIVAAGAPLGMLTGLIGGSLVAATWGWRAAFLVVGLPGVLLAILFWFTVREPERGSSDNRESSMRDAPSLTETFRYMWRTKTLRYVVLAITVATIPGFGANAWFPAFFMRTHELSIEQAGIILGLGGALSGMVGAIVGGIAFDRLARTSMAKAVKLVAWSQLVAFPASLLLYTAEHLVLATIFLVIPSMCAAFFAGRTSALVQSLSRVRMRAVAASITMLSVNLVGLGLGPTIIGVLSDVLEPRLGEDSLRYALMVVGLLIILSAFFFFRAAATVEDDMKAVDIAEAATA
jgi:predicted MFS family arabinose efflux permease